MISRAFKILLLGVLLAQLGFRITFWGPVGSGFSQTFRLVNSLAWNTDCGDLPDTCAVEVGAVEDRWLT